MNGDIILKKLKLLPLQVASMVDDMNCDDMDPQEVRCLVEFLPTREETEGLRLYLKNSKSRADALANLTPCEQYMVAMMVSWTLNATMRAA